MTTPTLLSALFALVPQWTATEDVKLTAANAATSDQFGSAVAIDGDTVVVGADGDNIGAPAFGGEGALHVYIRSGTSWSEQAKLRASNATGNYRLGFDVAISGDTILSGGGVSAASSGWGNVFVRSGTTWSEEALLDGSEAGINSGFGDTVALSGDTAALGAYGEDLPGGNDQGAVYVFARNGTNWAQQAKLTASDAETDQFLGYSVAIEGDTLLAGAALAHNGVIWNSGRVYVFVRHGTTWSEQATLAASVPSISARFGSAVSLSGDRALIGAVFDDHSGVSSPGAAYVFERAGSTWTEITKLIASDPGFAEYFGFSVALHGDTAVVGAINDSLPTAFRTGSAYVFSRDGGWQEQTKLNASDAADNDGFGWDVAVLGSTVVAGSIFDDTPAGADAGSAYAFTLSPEPVVGYCTSGTSASGCTASLSATGTASATAASGFLVSATGVEGEKNGILFYGANGRQATPWGNGTSFQCVVPPVRRGGLLVGRGTSGACDGNFAQDLNARWCPTCPKPGHNPGAGAVAQAQLWYRDPASTSNGTTSLSDAIEFGVGP